MKAAPAATRTGPGLRPCMSGFGIDVSRLMAAAGWKMNRITRTTKPDAVPTGPITALVLID